MSTLNSTSRCPMVHKPIPQKSYTNEPIVSNCCYRWPPRPWSISRRTSDLIVRFSQTNAKRLHPIALDTAGTPMPAWIIAIARSRNAGIRRDIWNVFLLPCEILTCYSNNNKLIEFTNRFVCTCRFSKIRSRYYEVFTCCTCKNAICISHSFT